MRLLKSPGYIGAFYVQDKVRPGTGREGGLGCERYFAIEHMDKVRPGTGREGSLGCVRREALWCCTAAKKQHSLDAPVINFPGSILFPVPAPVL
jgi:hypothetical protein